MRTNLKSVLALGVALSLVSAPAFAQAISVRDQRDERLDFPKAPERIVTIPIPAASTVITVDGGNAAAFPR